MSTETSTAEAIQKKVINTTSKVVPMHSQIKAMKVLMKAKKKVIGTKRPQINFVEKPYEKLKELTRGKAITAEALAEFVDTITATLPPDWMIDMTTGLSLV